jgi:hypothetical protein
MSCDNSPCAADVSAFYLSSAVVSLREVEEEISK